MPSKLNWLLENTSPGAIILQSWLTANGVSPQLAARYCSSNWLQKLRAGVYTRPGRQPEWQDAVYCLAKQRDMPVYLAGLTSLTHQGKSHYLKFEENSIWLGLPSGATLPLWFKKFPNSRLSADVEFSRSKPEWTIFTNNKLTKLQKSDLIEIEVKGLTLKASNQELAAFELLSAIPKRLSFEHAANVFQGLVSLRPKRVQSLLERSKSIATNRIFLFLAHYYNHPWASRLDETTIDLGAGKRQIVDNGKFDNSYQITVPKAFINHSQNTL